MRTERLFNKIRCIQNTIYSLAFKQCFKMIGKGFRVEYPLRLLGGKDISIGNYFNAFGRLRLEAFDNHNGYKFSPEIIIGNNVSLNFDCHIGCINRIKIGDNVLIASRVSILDHSHGEISSEALGIPPSKRKIVSKGPIIIEDNVWIGEGAVILPNVIIGKNTIIGANSVVTKSFPANSVIGGIPAKLIKQL